MGRERGRGRGAAQAGRGAAQTGRGAALGGAARTGDASKHEHDVCHCGMCEATVNDSAIGCDRCNAWFCPSEIWYRPPGDGHCPDIIIEGG